MAREAIESGEAPELAKAASADPEFSAKSIYNLAIQGDAAAQRIFQRFGEALGILLADLVNVLDLDMFVIGGGVVSAWDAFAPRCSPNCGNVRWSTPRRRPQIRWRKRKARRLKSQTTASKKTIITRALLGSDAGLYGAARIPAPGSAAGSSALWWRRLAPDSGQLHDRMVSAALRRGQVSDILRIASRNFSFCSRRPNTHANAGRRAPRAQRTHADAFLTQRSGNRRGILAQIAVKKIGRTSAQR